MPDNAFVKIGTALLKHQVKKLVGEETLGVISKELADIGGDKLDAWLGDKSTIEELKKAAQTAQDCFHDMVGDHELEQWMVSLPIGDLPKVTEALAKLPTSSDEQELESALRGAIADWGKLSPEQLDKAVNSFLSCLQSALLPIEKQTLMVIGRSVLRIEDKVDQLKKLVEQLKPYSIEAQATSRFGNINIGGNIDRSVFIAGNNNIVNYYAAVEANVEKHEPDYWALKHPYPMPPNFTGRIAERATLTHWLKEDSENRLFILRALGGFGKSALTWHWLTHDVDIKEYPKVVFWSFYEGDASFEHFVEETLKYLKLEVPQGGRPQVDKLLDAIQTQIVLLIMDGFERVLRLYASMNAPYQSDEDQHIEENELDCKDINAEWFLKGVCARPDFKSKVLMTTRLTPRAVKPRGEFLLGCREEELTAMQPADAVEFFHKQKIKGTHAEIEAACAPYGYHPLSLRLLAGRISKDFENPADIVVAQKLKIDGDIIQQKHHVLEVSYNSLSAHEQKMLSTIACFRSPVELKTLQSIVENKDTLDDDLHDLVERGLLHFDDKYKKFDLHPIVRHYAYEHMTNQEKKNIHAQIAMHFTNLITTEKIQSLEELHQVIELYHNTVKAENYDEALSIYGRHLKKPIYHSFGQYNLQIELLDAIFYHVENLSDLIYITNDLANSYSMVGNPNMSIELHKLILSIDGQTKNNIGMLLGNSVVTKIQTGAFLEADKYLRQQMEIAIENQLSFIVGFSHELSGRLYIYQGFWDKAEQELMFAKTQGFKSLVPSFQAKNNLLHARWLTFSHEQNNNIVQVAIDLAKQAIEYAVEERDLIRGHWILGAAYRCDKQLDLAEHHLTEALTRDRAVNNVAEEADILLDLARLRYDQKNYEDAKSLVDEALLITERCGYVLQGADVNLFLAQYALEQEQDKAKAKQYAEEAKKLATCDGPPYYYKVAYEEAERFLEQLAG